MQAASQLSPAHPPTLHPRRRKACACPPSPLPPPPSCAHACRTRQRGSLSINRGSLTPASHRDAPHSTLSLLSEQSILFGASIGIIDEGQFSAPFACPLPVGSVLVLDGNGANVAKHCVPSVKADRVSITFRKIGSKIKMRAFEGPDGSIPQPTGQSAH